MELILASRSPRRQELIKHLGLPFTVSVPEIDETMNPDLPPEDEVARVSRLKAEAVGGTAAVVAADTIVVCDGKVLGKPKDKAQAVEMLTMLSGRGHLVMTGLTVRTPAQTLTHTEITQVFFRDLSPEEILAYVESGEPMDKAGAYGIQGGASIFTEKIIGDYYNVMGLPLCRLSQMLKTIKQ